MKNSNLIIEKSSFHFLLVEQIRIYFGTFSRHWLIFMISLHYGKMNKRVETVVIDRHSMISTVRTVCSIQNLKFQENLSRWMYAIFRFNLDCYNFITYNLSTVNYRPRSWICKICTIAFSWSSLRIFATAMTLHAVEFPTENSDSLMLPSDSMVYMIKSRLTELNRIRTEFNRGQPHEDYRWLWLRVFSIKRTHFHILGWGKILLIWSAISRNKFQMKVFNFRSI